MKKTTKISHGLDGLPEHEKKHIVSAREELNTTLGTIDSVEDIKNRFSLKYIKDEGYWLFDNDMNKNIGYIHMGGVDSKGVLSIQAYGINPVYQKYGLSSVMLGIFVEHVVPRLEEKWGRTLAGVVFGTTLLREHITASSLKHFTVRDGVIHSANLDDIYNSSLQKLTHPHLEFNSSTGHVHIGKYGLL